MVEIGDGFLRRQQPLLSVEDMEARISALRGATGIKLARKAMRYIRPRTDSMFETRTRMVLVQAGLPTPVVNLPVWCPAVGVTYHVDMGYEHAKLAVEYDGAVHVQDRLQMEIDADRRRNLQDAGWMIITVTAALLREPSSIIRSVENALILRMR